MKRRKQFYILPLILASSLMLSACGGQSSQIRPVDTGSNNLTGNTGGNNNGTGTGTGNNNDNDTTDETPTDNTVTFTGDFSLAGLRSLSGSPTSANTTKTPAINTDSKLQMTFTGNASGTVSSTGYTIYSSCLSFDVALYNSDTNKQIGGTRKVYVNTNTSNGNTNCTGSPDGKAHPSVDFSSSLPTGSRSSVYAIISNAYSDSCGPNSGYGTSMECVGWSYYYYTPVCIAYAPKTCYQQLYYNWTVSGGYSVKTNALQ